MSGHGVSWIQIWPGFYINPFKNVGSLSEPKLQTLYRWRKLIHESIKMMSWKLDSILSSTVVYIIFNESMSGWQDFYWHEWIHKDYQVMMLNFHLLFSPNFLLLVGFPPHFVNKTIRQLLPWYLGASCLPYGSAKASLLVLNICRTYVLRTRHCVHSVYCWGIATRYYHSGVDNNSFDSRWTCT